CSFRGRLRGGSAALRIHECFSRSRNERLAVASRSSSSHGPGFVRRRGADRPPSLSTVAPSSVELHVVENDIDLALRIGVRGTVELPLNAQKLRGIQSRLGLAADQVAPWHLDHLRRLGNRDVALGVEGTAVAEGAFALTLLAAVVDGVVLR